MAGKGPRPKDPALRQRTNKTSTRAEVEVPSLVDPDSPRTPELPVRVCSSCESTIDETPRKTKKKRGRQRKPEPACSRCGGTRLVPWHWMTVAWWADVWNPKTNPFCAKYIGVDVHGLVRLARLVDHYNLTDDLDDLKEIRLQEPRWGLDQMSRRALQWHTKEPKTHPAAVSTAATETAPPARHDPRKGLFAVGGGRA